jgi:hypothetical protein
MNTNDTETAGPFPSITPAMLLRDYRRQKAVRRHASSMEALLTQKPNEQDGRLPKLTVSDLFAAVEIYEQWLRQSAPPSRRTSVASSQTSTDSTTGEDRTFTSIAKGMAIMKKWDSGYDITSASLKMEELYELVHGCLKCRLQKQ